MRKEKKPFQEKKSKAVHKATAPFGQREPCVSPRRAFASAMRREGRKNPLIHLPFLLGTQCVRVCDFFTYILLSEISVRGNKHDPGGFVSRCAERGCVRWSKPIQQSARPLFSVETETQGNHTSSEQKFTRYSPTVALGALTDSDRGHATASPRPLLSTRQTPIHPATACLCAAALTVGSSHFLISRRSWIQPQ